VKYNTPTLLISLLYLQATKIAVFLSSKIIRFM